MRRHALASPLLLLLLLLCPTLATAESSHQSRLAFNLMADHVPSVGGITPEVKIDSPDGTDQIGQVDTALEPPAPSPQGSADLAPQAMPVELTRPVSPVVSTNAAPRFGVSEAFRSDASTQLSLSWDRIIFSWPAIQPGGPNDWNVDNYFGQDNLNRDLSRGLDVVGLLQFTPGWAAQNGGDGQRSVPRNLSAPANSPDNYWARFAGKIAGHYKGKIDRWVIWNEPEFKPGDKGAGQSYTWMGSDADYYMLLKRAYQAIKAANPNATVIFGATSYWVDVNMGRPPFFKRIMDIAAADPEAKANGFFFDVVAFNIYRAPDDLLRIHTEMKQAMKAKGIDKPIWLTETNAMPYDDPVTPKAQDGQRVTMSVQADYVAQAMAISAAAGYERVGWYRINDGGVWREQEVWGLLRDDNSQRPAFQAFKSAAAQMVGAKRVSFVPLERDGQPFGTPWPQDPSSYYPNWLVYQVAFDHPDGRRATVLWNAGDSPLRVRVPKLGSGAVLLDKLGNQLPLVEMSGWYVVDLPPSNIKGPFDPDGYHYIGGPTFILVEKSVPADSPVQEPRLGDPGSAQPGVTMALDPAAFKFRPGETAQFTLRLKGIEGFNTQMQLSAKGLPAGIGVEMPSTAFPGDKVGVTVRSDGGLKPGLYVDEVFIEACGGGVTARVPLNMEVVP